MIAIEPHPKLSSSIDQVGAERSPVLVIDNLAADPAALIDAADEAIFLKLGPLYPGVRAPAPEAYARTLFALLSPLAENAFGARIDSKLELCAFSLVTTPPEHLSVAQRIPHFDGTETDRLAFVHYLCREEYGGTSFYRHRATGFETVSEARLEAYGHVLDQDMRNFGQPDGYIAGDTEIFECIKSYPAKFNRIILYRGAALHSGNITAACTLDESARSGRLTMNGFARLISRT